MTGLTPIHSEQPTAAVAEAVSQYIRARGDRPTLLMIAGGSLPETVLPQVDQAILGPALTIGIFDERCTEDEAGLNELQLQATPFFAAAVAAGANVLDVVVGDSSTCDVVAADWQERLRTWAAAHPDGEIVVLAGVGADGHIAGILVHEESETECFTGSDWIVAHRFKQTDNHYPHRITPTFTFWQEAVAATFIYMNGPEKQAALAAIMAPSGDLATTPGRVLRSLAHVRLYTDQVEYSKA